MFFIPLNSQLLLGLDISDFDELELSSSYSSLDIFGCRHFYQVVDKEYIDEMNIFGCKHF
jgi:hypothetical protein